MRNRFWYLIIWFTSVFILIGCATLPENTNRVASFAYQDTDDTRIGRARRTELEAHPGQSGFFLLGNGLDAFVARAVLAHFADRSIDAQYYLLHNDLTGLLFIDQLVKAADRGVRVRLLVDDMDLAGKDVGATALDSHPNIEVRLFNPFSRKTGRTMQFVTGLGSITRRMHNKSFTVDNQVTILGGRNIGDEYFDADPDVAFADLDVIALGPVAKEVSASFDQYWNSELAYPASALIEKPPTPEEIEAQFERLKDFVAQQADSAYLQALRDSNLANLMRKAEVHYYWGEAQVVVDRPEKLLHATDRTEFHMARQLAPYLKGIQKELIIFSPYFVPGRAGTAFLTELSKKGVRVRILTNSLSSTDVGIVHAGYSRYRRQLLRGGVELYELNKKPGKKKNKDGAGKHGSSSASLHAKSFVFDREKVFIGSLNLDPRSVKQNTEVGVVFSSSEVANSMAQLFDRNIDEVAFRLELKTDEGGNEIILWHGTVEGEQRVFRADPYTGFWQRLGISLMSALPIESQL